MKLIVLTIGFCLLVFIKIYSQFTTDSYGIEGTVSSTEQSIARATVVLRHLQRNKSTTILTDSTGNYLFDSIPPGTYLLEVSAVGFITFKSDSLVLPNAAKRLKQDIVLTVKKSILDEIVVKARKPRIEIDKGKIVLNVENSSLTTGISAFDLLKNLPGLSIGQDDDISLRGTGGINVMIDGKMSYLSGKQLAILLKGLSAENIARLELLTAPTAEFDASGNAGIINIVTRKRNVKGSSIDLRSAITKGRYWMVNENITATFNTGKFNIYTSLDYNTPHSFMDSKSSALLKKTMKKLC